MKKWAPLLLLLLPGGALAAGWWWWRRRATSAPVMEFDALDVTASAAGADVAKVFHDERVQGLAPELVLAVEEYARYGPLPITVTSGLRTDEEQRALYAKGRTVAGSIVTNAQTAADSAHGRAAAFDFAPVREVSNGAVRRVWLGEEAEEKYRVVGEWFEARGLVWGGRWRGLVDMPHVELLNWRALPFPPRGVA